MRGKVTSGSTASPLLADHPRLCGEKALTVSTMLFQIGSPPPMRGKVIAMNTTQTGDRITPAYAGKSLALMGGNPIDGDHPRLCGEKKS